MLTLITALAVKLMQIVNASMVNILIFILQPTGHLLKKQELKVVLVDVIQQEMKLLLLLFSLILELMLKN